MTNECPCKECIMLPICKFPPGYNLTGGIHKLSKKCELFNIFFKSITNQGSFIKVLLAYKFLAPPDVKVSFIKENIGYVSSYGEECIEIIKDWGNEFYDELNKLLPLH